MIETRPNRYGPQIDLQVTCGRHLLVLTGVFSMVFRPERTRAGSEHFFGRGRGRLCQFNGCPRPSNSDGLERQLPADLDGQRPVSSVLPKSSVVGHIQQGNLQSSRAIAEKTCTTEHRARLAHMCRLHCSSHIGRPPICNLGFAKELGTKHIYTPCMTMPGDSSGKSTSPSAKPGI